VVFNITSYSYFLRQEIKKSIAITYSWWFVQDKITILVGPLPDPVTGQSIAFKALVDGFNYNKKVFDYSFSKGSFFHLLIRNIHIVVSFLVFCIFNKKKIS